MGNDSTPIEILVTTSEEARDQANNVERMLTGKSVALDLARQDGYVAFKVVGNDDRLFVTSPLNITK